jgi:ketosteroid isomerase-like protein
MKSTIKRSLLMALLSITAFTTALKAQNASKELLKLASKYEAAYNSKDDKAIKMMYTEDALRIAPDGTTLTGNEAIRADFVKSTTGTQLKVEIKQDKTETNNDGSVTVTGTYHVTGTLASGESLDIKGSFTNNVVKLGGHWKIKKSVLVTL